MPDHWAETRSGSSERAGGGPGLLPGGTRPHASVCAVPTVPPSLLPSHSHPEVGLITDRAPRLGKVQSLTHM